MNIFPPKHLKTVLCVVALAISVSACSDDDPTTPVVEEGRPAGFIINTMTGITTESGGSTTYSLRLDGKPNGNVVVNVDSGDPGECTVSPEFLIFTVDNFSTPQNIIATGVNDSFADGDQLFFIALTVNVDNTTDTTGYASLDPDDLAVTNLDDD